MEKEKKEKMPRCPHCNSTNVQGYSRVVGYFSIINNWNKGKIAEWKDRQKGNYSLNADIMAKHIIIN